MLVHMLVLSMVSLKLTMIASNRISEVLWERHYCFWASPKKRKMGKPDFEEWHTKFKINVKIVCRRDDRLHVSTVHLIA